MFGASPGNWKKVSGSRGRKCKVIMGSLMLFEGLHSVWCGVLRFRRNLGCSVRVLSIREARTPASCPPGIRGCGRFQIKTSRQKVCATPSRHPQLSHTLPTAPLNCVYHSSRPRLLTLSRQGYLLDTDVHLRARRASVSHPARTAKCSVDNVYTLQP